MTDQTSTPEGSMQERPRTREDLLRLHADARRRRNAAELDSEPYRAATLEVGQIEIEIAALETGVPPSRR
jgi:hypothetical protein